VKAILRSAVVAAGIAAASVAGVMPASAAQGGAFAFTGETTLTCFGCGHKEGQSATLNVTGATLTPPGTLGGSANASFAIDEQGGALCLVTGSANGSVSGAGLSVNFNWTRVGAVAVITTTGSVNGAGVAVFVTDPGITCGGPVHAQFAGAVAGS
jgi:hypothetical protein